jgi:hypothetical protein
MELERRAAAWHINSPEALIFDVQRLRAPLAQSEGHLEHYKKVMNTILESEGIIGQHPKFVIR